MQTDPKTIKDAASLIRKSPAEIVDDMLDRLMPVSYHRIYAEHVVKNMPEHIQQACAYIHINVRRAKVAETFKTWGTPQEIADHIMQKNKDFVKNYTMTPNRFSKVIKDLSSSRTAQSLVGPSGFFPCPPELQNQLSSDVLE